MYFSSERNAFDVPAGERLLLWGMRAWSYSLHTRACPFPLLLPVFCRMGVAGAVVDFHRTMSALQLGGVDLAPLSPARGDQLGDEEVVLLLLWRQALAADGDAAVRLIECLVTPDWVPQCFERMMAAAQEFHFAHPALFPDGGCECPGSDAGAAVGAVAGQGMARRTLH